MSIFDVFSRRTDARITEAVTAYSRGMGSIVSSLAREDIGWKGFGEKDEDVVPLPVLKDHSRRARHLASYNPLVKRGINIRNAYMWYDLPEVRDTGKVQQVKALHDSLLSMDARSRDESALCTDGIVIYLASRRRKEVRPVPLSRVRAVARADDASDEGDLYAFLIEPVPTTDATSNERRDPVWYVVDGKKQVRVDSEEGYKTDSEWTVVYLMVHRQVGEMWGKPDLMGAVYWARAYKEYLEAAHTMSKALARIAFKVNSASARQQQAVIQQMSGAQGVGATASLAPGQELTAVSKAGAGIDMMSGTPLAAMVSAALDVPLSVLLTDGSAGGRQGAETALEEPTFKAFEARRSLHVDLIRRVLAAVGIRAEVEVAPLSSELIQRWGQVIVLGTQNGYLHQAEARQLYLDRFKPRNARPVDDLPEMPDASTDGAGPLSDGTNANRDEDGGETVA